MGQGARRKPLATLAFLLLLLRGAAAEEFDVGEKAWVRTCVENLAAKSDRVRASAEKALAQLGHEALPTVLVHLPKLKTDVDWKALERALVAMGPATAQELLALRASWPKGTHARLEAVIEKLREAPPEPSRPLATGGVPGDSPVEREVLRLLDRYRDASSMTSNDPEILELAEMGHQAFAPLVKVLRDRASAVGMVRSVVATVLEQVGREGDEEVVAELLREGHFEAAAALRRVRTIHAMEVLVDCVDRGFAPREVLRSLERWRKENRVTGALMRWLAKHGRSGSHDAAAVAEFLGDARHAEAAPLLAEILPATEDAGARVRVAKALADVGDKRGIPALIDVLEAKSVGFFDPDAWARHHAGETLNRIAGQAHYVGRFSPGAADGNYPEAAKAFREWWERVKDTIRWDPEKKAWGE